MSKPTGRHPEINITPLIDVLLVLLIIFMVVAPSRPGQFETKVPARPSDDRPEPPASSVLVVTMDEHRVLSLNGATLTLEALAAELTSILADRTDHTVILRAPKGVPYREVVRLVDEIKGAGANPIGLQVDFLGA